MKHKRLCLEFHVRMLKDRSTPREYPTHRYSVHINEVLRDGVWHAHKGKRKVAGNVVVDNVAGVVPIWPFSGARKRGELNVHM
jgi:hypothetical protein